MGRVKFLDPLGRVVWSPQGGLDRMLLPLPYSSSPHKVHPFSAGKKTWSKIHNSLNCDHFSRQGTYKFGTPVVKSVIP